MENIIFNELKIRGFNVDVGVVTLNKTNEKGHGIRKQVEIDFVCNKGSKRYYIQSAYAIPDQEKMKQEQRSLMLFETRRSPGKPFFVRHKLSY